MCFQLLGFPIHLLEADTHTRQLRGLRSWEVFLLAATGLSSSGDYLPHTHVHDGELASPSALKTTLTRHFLSLQCRKPWRKPRRGKNSLHTQVQSARWFNQGLGRRKIVCLLTLAGACGPLGWKKSVLAHPHRADFHVTAGAPPGKNPFSSFFVSRSSTAQSLPGLEK